MDPFWADIHPWNTHPAFIEVPHSAHALLMQLISFTFSIYVQICIHVTPTSVYTTMDCYLFEREREMPFNHLHFVFLVMIAINSFDSTEL